MSPAAAAPSGREPEGASARSRSGPAGAGTEPHAGSEPEEQSQRLLSQSALAVFGLNGQFLRVAEQLARPAGLTAAWWQVLGATRHGPLPVARIARHLGITRQSVQRVADLLVEHGLAAYEPNPAHRRARLLSPTVEGREAMREISPDHAEFAARLSEALGGQAEFARVRGALRELSEALDVVNAGS